MFSPDLTARWGRHLESRDLSLPIRHSSRRRPARRFLPEPDSETDVIPRSTGRLHVVVRTPSGAVL